MRKAALQLLFNLAYCTGVKFRLRQSQSRVPASAWLSESPQYPPRPCQFADFLGTPKVNLLGRGVFRSASRN
jgi:hypothetical protein